MLYFICKVKEGGKKKNMKKYQLKAQYKIMLYLIILFMLLKAMIQCDSNILIITMYYIIVYNIIKTGYKSIKKEDHRTTSKSSGSSKNNAK